VARAADRDRDGVEVVGDRQHREGQPDDGGRGDRDDVDQRAVEANAIVRVTRPTYCGADSATYR
jgi:hypothetical protein